MTGSFYFVSMLAMSLRSFSCAFWLLFAGFCLVGMSTQAQEEVVAEEEAEVDAAKSAKKKKSKKKGKKKDSRKGTPAKDEAASPASAQEPAVVNALKAFKVHNAKVNTRADYYVYLYSASWCGFCQQCMPVAVEQYKKMRMSRKVELIVIGGDKSEKEAIRYLKSYKLKAPGIMFDALKATQFTGLPGCGFPGFPATSVVTKDGRMLKNVIGASQVKEVLNNWQQIIQEN